MITLPQTRLSLAVSERSSLRSDRKRQPYKRSVCLLVPMSLNDSQSTFLATQSPTTAYHVRRVGQTRPAFVKPLIYQIVVHTRAHPTGEWMVRTGQLPLLFDMLVMKLS